VSDGDDGSEEPEIPPHVAAKLAEGRRIGFEMTLVQTHDFDLAEDIAQVVQESLWMMWLEGSLDLSKPLAPLAFTIVGRRCANILRDEANHELPRIKLSYALDTSGQVQLDSALHLEATELGDALNAALEMMPAIQREVWEAIKVRGETREQVASAMGKTLASVDAHLYGANLALKATAEKVKESGR
jgi:DNA-directed RNA polymerase specialized sigma24 family protein